MGFSDDGGGLVSVRLGWRACTCERERCIYDVANSIYTGYLVSLGWAVDWGWQCGLRVGVAGF